MTLVQDLEADQKEAQDRCTALDEKVKATAMHVLAGIDSNPMEVHTTPQANFAAKNADVMSDDQLRKSFRLDFTRRVSHAQKHESYCLLRRRFPFISPMTIHRALDANLGHLAGALRMLEGWSEAGKPERFPWIPICNQEKPKFIRMTSTAQDLRTQKKNREATEDLMVTPSGAVLLEMQYLETLKAKKPNANVENTSVIAGDKIASSYSTPMRQTDSGKEGTTNKVNSATVPRLRNKTAWPDIKERKQVVKTKILPSTIKTQPIWRY